MGLGSFLTTLPKPDPAPSPPLGHGPWGNATLPFSEAGTCSWMMTSTKGSAGAVTGSSWELCAALESVFPLSSGTRTGKMLGDTLEVTPA